MQSRRWLALVMLGAIFTLTLLDATIVYPALPRIRDDLDFGFIESRWVMITYLAAFGGLLVLCHQVANRLDRRLMFMSGVALFAAASLLAAVSWSFDVLLAARVAQGAAAAIIAPTTLPLVVMAFHETAGQRMAMRVWTVVGAVSGTAGLLMGGLLAAFGSWRWIFLINLPICLLVLVLSPLLPPAGRGTRPPAQRLEFIQTANVTIAVVLLIMAIAGITPSHWNADTTVILLVGVIALVLLSVFTQRRAWPPLSPWRLLHSRATSGGVVILVVAGLAFDGTLLLLMHYTQDIRGYSAWTFALAMTVFTISAALGSLAVQALLRRFAVRTVAAAAAALMGLGFLALMSISAGRAPLGGLLVGAVLVGLAVGGAFVAAQVTVVMQAASMGSTVESGLTDTSFAFGGAVGLGLLSTVAASAGLGTHSDARLPGSVVDLTASLRPAFGVAAGCALLAFAAAIVLLPKAFPPISASGADADPTSGPQEPVSQI